MNYAGMMQQATSGSGKDEEEEEQRRRMLLGLPLLGAMTADAQPFAGNVPVVQGTPTTSGVPMVQGTPSIGGASSAQSASSAPFNAPSTHALYQTGTSFQPHGVQHPPLESLILAHHHPPINLLHHSSSCPNMDRAL